MADLFVDPALGFSLGWAAWVSTNSICFCADVILILFKVQLECDSSYAKSMILEIIANVLLATEIAAAAVVVGFWDTTRKIS